MERHSMKKLLFLVGIVVSLVLLSVPAVSAIGGDEGWIEIRCNVDGARVYFDGSEKGTISGGSLTVAVYSTATPYNSFTVEKSGYTTFSGQLSMPASGETRTFYATLNPIPTPFHRSIMVQSMLNHHLPAPRCILMATTGELPP